MGRVVSAFCCLVVGLQILVGVPLVVCVAFLLFVDSDTIGPLTVDLRFGDGVEDASPPEPAVGSATASAPPRGTEFADILDSRLQRGSPLQGTVLADSMAPAGEETDFVAALRRIAADERNHQPPTVVSTPPVTVPIPASDADDWTQIDQSLLVDVARRYCRHLYAVADRHEDAGDYAQADGLRRRARDFRSEVSALASEPRELPLPPLAPDTMHESLPGSAAEPSLEAAPDKFSEAIKPGSEQPRAN